MFSDPINFIDPTGLDAWRTAAGFVPVLGSGLDAYDSFQQGNYGWALAHAALAVTDLSGAGAIAKGLNVGAFKVGSRKLVKEVYKEGARMAYGNVRKRLLRRNLVTRNLPTHHWALQQNQGLGKALREKFGDDVADRFINHPANLMPDIDPLLHGRAHNGSWLEYLRYGTPTWGKLGAAGIGSYSIGLGVDAE